MSIYTHPIFIHLSFKKCNKLDEYIYTYFFIILIIPLNNFSIIKIVVDVIRKNKNSFFFCYIVGIS